MSRLQIDAESSTHRSKCAAVLIDVEFGGKEQDKRHEIAHDPNMAGLDGDKLMP